MEVTLVDHTRDPEKKIATYAAVCYNSPVNQESLDKRVRHLMKVKHLATLRFANATFFIRDISRACSHQIVRHPHLSFLQESQRYVDQSHTNFYIPPTVAEFDHHLFSDTYRHQLQAYKFLIRNGIKKEDARLVLPIGATSSMYVTGNFQAWYDMLVSRTDTHAQLEIREVSMEILKHLNKVAPNVFGGLLSWRLNEK